MEGLKAIFADAIVSHLILPYINSALNFFLYEIQLYRFIFTLFYEAIKAIERFYFFQCSREIQSSIETKKVIQTVF